MSDLGFNIVGIDLQVLAPDLALILESFAEVLGNKHVVGARINPLLGQRAVSVLVHGIALVRIDEVLGAFDVLEAYRRQRSIVENQSPVGVVDVDDVGSPVGDVVTSLNPDRWLVVHHLELSNPVLIESSKVQLVTLEDTICVSLNQ